MYWRSKVERLVQIYLIIHPSRVSHPDVHVADLPYKGDPRPNLVSSHRSYTFINRGGCGLRSGRTRTRPVAPATRLRATDHGQANTDSERRVRHFGRRRGEINVFAKDGPRPYITAVVFAYTRSSSTREEIPAVNPYEANDENKCGDEDEPCGKYAGTNGCPRIPGGSSYRWVYTSENASTTNSFGTS